MLLRCFSDVSLLFMKCLIIIILSFCHLITIKIYSKHVIKSQYFRAWKTVTFCRFSYSPYSGSPRFNKSHLIKNIGNRPVPELRMPTHNLFISKPIIKSSRRCDLQPVIIHCHLYAGSICQITMTMCIDNHFTNGFYRKLIRLFSDQSLNCCAQTDIP